MTLDQLLNIVACIAIFLFGFYALSKPRDAAQMAHITLGDSTATAEIRITFGGLSIAMGAAPLYFNQPIAYQVVGLIWLIAFATRLVATFLDRPPLARTYVISGAFELIVGLILFL